MNLETIVESPSIKPSDLKGFPAPERELEKFHPSTLVYVLPKPSTLEGAKKLDIPLRPSGVQTNKQKSSMRRRNSGPVLCQGVRARCMQYIQTENPNQGITIT